MRNTYPSKVGMEGRVLLPRPVREATGLAPGTEVVVGVDGGRVVIVSREVLLGDLQRRFAAVPGSLADELITDRRVQAESDRSV